MKLYLCGTICASEGARTAFERGLPGSQGRRTLAFMTLRRRTGVTRDELADAIWGEEVPASVESSLNALASKVRSWLGSASAGNASALTAGGGQYRLRLPADTWVDVERVNDYTERAQSEFEDGQMESSYAWASAAWSTTHLPFLAGEDAPWINVERARLQKLHIVTLEMFGEYYLAKRKTTQAIDYLEQILALNPLRESAYRSLMKAHQVSGNRAEAIAVFGRCRSTLHEELAVAPAPETREIYDALLGAF